MWKQILMSRMFRPKCWSRWSICRSRLISGLWMIQLWPLSPVTIHMKPSGFSTLTTTPSLSSLKGWRRRRIHWGNTQMAELFQKQARRSERWLFFTGKSKSGSRFYAKLKFWLACLFAFVFRTYFVFKFQILIYKS